MSKRETKHTAEHPEQGKATFSDEQLRVFGDIFPGFADWYRTNYDQDGNYIGAGMPGLRRKDDTRGEG